MTNLFAQYQHKVTKPLFPPLIHDDTTRIVVIVIGLIITIGILIWIMRKLNNG